MASWPPASSMRYGIPPAASAGLAALGAAGILLSLALYTVQNVKWAGGKRQT